MVKINKFWLAWGLIVFMMTWWMALPLFILSMGWVDGQEPILLPVMMGCLCVNNFIWVFAFEAGGLEKYVK